MQKKILETRLYMPNTFVGKLFFRECVWKEVRTFDSNNNLTCHIQLQRYMTCVCMTRIEVIMLSGCSAACEGLFIIIIIIDRCPSTHLYVDLNV